MSDSSHKTNKWSGPRWERTSRELAETLTFTNTDMCEQMLKEWHQTGPKLLSLTCGRQKSLLSFRMLIFNGRGYCLTRMCFEQNVIPTIMKSIVNATIPEDSIRQATPTCIDKIYVNGCIAYIVRVQKHQLADYELTSNELKQLKNVARVLNSSPGSLEATVKSTRDVWETGVTPYAWAFILAWRGEWPTS